MLKRHKQNDLTYYCYKWNSSILKKIYRLRKSRLTHQCQLTFCALYMWVKKLIKQNHNHCYTSGIKQNTRRKYTMQWAYQ